MKSMKDEIGTKSIYSKREKYIAMNRMNILSHSIILRELSNKEWKKYWSK